MSALARTENVAFDALPDPSPTVRPLVSFLRVLALACRSSAREDLFKACAILSHEPNISAHACGEALVKCLSQALGKRPIFHAITEPELSFDEAWLSQLSEAIQSGDAQSEHFLLRSRVHKDAQRNVSFLMSRLTQHFYLI
ncbi:MAG: hypothetical protein AAF198_01340 [Pseudomonadota bacterium]